VVLDPGIVELIAERQEKTNHACSDASYLKTAAIAMIVFLGLSCLPFVPLVDWAFLITFVIVVVLLIRWQIRFGQLLTNDPDYLIAKKRKNLALILLLIATPVGFIARPLIFFFLGLS
jgi:hypothetical protein